MKLGSICTGYGGLDQAVMAATGAELAWVSDNDPDVSLLLKHHHPEILNLGDISEVDWAQVEPVDIICGGTPCQDISAAGKGLGMFPGTRSGLWSYMAGAISVIRPEMVVWENVRGAFSARAHSNVGECEVCLGNRAGDVLRSLGRVLGDLADLGYDAEWSVVRASDVGACHRRERVFVLAYPQGD